ncbi:protein of unknown function [Burkholderia multivorans]
MLATLNLQRAYRSIKQSWEKGRLPLGFLSEALNELQLSPLTTLYRPELYWTSTAKTLNSGLHVAYAGSSYHPIPSGLLGDAWRTDDHARNASHPAQTSR